jgi:hypothetical protein
MAGIVGALWAGLLWVGLGGVRDIASRHIAGYPSSDQITYYVGIPLTVVVGLLIAGVTLNILGRMPGLLVILSGCTFLSLLPYLTAWTGGV